MLSRPLVGLGQGQRPLNEREGILKPAFPFGQPGFGIQRKRIVRERLLQGRDFGIRSLDLAGVVERVGALKPRCGLIRSGGEGQFEIGKTAVMIVQQALCLAAIEVGDRLLQIGQIFPVDQL